MRIIFEGFVFLIAMFTIFMAYVFVAAAFDPLWFSFSWVR